MRAPLKLLLLGVAVFAAAFAVRHVLFAGVLPVGAAEGPQSVWALEAAFALRTIENIAVFGSTLVVFALIGSWFGRRGKPRSPKLSSGDE